MTSRSIVVICALLAADVLLSGCVAPCQSAIVLSAYKAESSMCIRVSDTEAEAVECLAGVTAEYAPQLKEIGEDVADALAIITK